MFGKPLRQEQIPGGLLLHHPTLDLRHDCLELGVAVEGLQVRIGRDPIGVVVAAIDDLP